MEDDLSFDEQDMIDRDLANPEFVSWTARREARHLLDVVHQLFPDNAEIINLADRAHEMICTIDDGIEGWMT